MKSPFYTILMLLWMLPAGAMAQNAQSGNSNANGNAVSAQSLKTLKGKLTKAQWERVVAGTSDAATDSVFLSVVGGSLAQRYASAQLAKIQNSGKLNATQVSKITRDFETLLSRGIPNGDTFLEALRLNTSDTAVYGALFRDQINLQAKNKSAVESAALAKRNGLSAPSATQLQRMLYQKNKEMEVIQFSYPALSEKSAEQQYALSQRYDSLTTKLYYANGVKSPDNYFFYALGIKTTLGVNATQEEQLMAQGLLLPQLTEKAIANKETTFRPRLYEHQKLVEILTESQYDQFLAIRNQENALFFTLRDWKEIKQYGVVAPGYTTSDSTRICAMVYRYQLARCIVTDRYTGDTERRIAAHAAIDTAKPSDLIKLATAKKTATVSSASTASTTKAATQVPTVQSTPSEDKVYRGSFSW